MKPVVKLDTYKDPSLFSVRSINSLSELDARLFGGRKIYLLPGCPDVQGVMSDSLGKYVQMDIKVDILEIGKYLPFSARPKIIPLMMDMIPESSWGSSLANMLTKTSWDRLREKAASRTGGICSICGVKKESLDAHEIWEYHEPIGGNKSVCGVQKLQLIAPLCPSCHLVFHLGMANVLGKLERTLDRLAVVNRLSSDEVDDYYEMIESRFERRSEYPWVLDLSLVKDDDLVVSSSWKTIEGGWLESPKGVSMILGAPWKYPGKDQSVFPVRSTEEGYFG